MTVLFFFFNDTATTEIYTLSLHDALPISFFNPMKSSLSGRSQASVRHKIAGSARFSDLSLKRQNSPHIHLKTHSRTCSGQHRLQPSSKNGLNDSSYRLSNWTESLAA